MMNKNGVSESLKTRWNERRSKLEIIGEVLSVARNGARKTEIVYRTNLNFTRLASYIQYLEEKKFLETSDHIFKTTSKGEEFLRDYQNMRDVLLTEEA
jgi:predicted transcriptional regulator